MVRASWRSWTCTGPRLVDILQTSNGQWRTQTTQSTSGRRSLRPSRGNPSVIFDAFNEPKIGLTHPSNADWSCWLNGCFTSFKLCQSSAATNCTTIEYQSVGMQSIINAIRQTGAKQPIMVGGLNWSSDPCGLQNKLGNGGNCSWLEYAPTDPLGQLIVSFHEYNMMGCNTSACWNQDVLPVAKQVPCGHRRIR